MWKLKKNGRDNLLKTLWCTQMRAHVEKWTCWPGPCHNKLINFISECNRFGVYPILVDCLIIPPFETATWYQVYHMGPIWVRLHNFHPTASSPSKPYVPIKSMMPNLSTLFPIYMCLRVFMLIVDCLSVIPPDIKFSICTLSEKDVIIGPK